MLGVSSDTVRELIRANALPHKRLGRRVVIPAEAFARWLNDVDGWQSAEAASHG
jgi:excisionase family DNA binding protein